MTAGVASLVLLLVVTILIETRLTLPADPTQRLEYLKLILDVYKAIGIGFLIALLGTLVPHLLPEARYEFELLKDGRALYSKAKTGIDYLPYRLSELSFADGIRHIEEVHQLKHLAETYMRETSRVGKFPYDAYQEINVYRQVLVDAAPSWDDLSREQRLARFPARNLSEGKGAVTS
jgi:hypothetical protein